MIKTTHRPDGVVDVVAAEPAAAAASAFSSSSSLAGRRRIGTKRRRRRGPPPRTARLLVTTTLFASVMATAASAGAADATTCTSAAAFCHRRRRTGTANSAVALTSASSVELDVVELCHAEYSHPTHERDLHEPVILLHGLLGSKRNFASLASSLSSRLGKPRRILAVDLRNHGENPTEGWRDDMSYPSMARDVLGVMDREGIHRAVLVGHSMGGKVAASLSLMEPERVGGLVVLDIAPVRYCPSEDVSWGAVKASIDAIAGVRLNNDDDGNDGGEGEGEGDGGGCETKRDVDLALRSTLEDPALRAFVLTNLDQDRKAKELRWKINVEAISDQLDVIAGFDLPGGNSGDGDDDEASNSTPRYEGDVFIIAGGSSRFVSQKHLPVVSNYFPNYMLTTVRGAGHWVHAEAPDDTLALLKRYLDR